VSYVSGICEETDSFTHQGPDLEHILSFVLRSSLR